MPVLVPYHLSFRRGFHLGARGISLGEEPSSIPADTLFSALVDTAGRSGADPAALIRSFLDPAGPPFRLTSAFPFAGGVRFYPMPVDLRGLFTREALEEDGKSLGRIRYLSEGLLRAVQSGTWHGGTVPVPYAAPEQRGGTVPVPYAAPERHGGLWSSPMLPPRRNGDDREAVRKMLPPVIPLQGGSLLLSPAELEHLPEALRVRPENAAALDERAVWKHGTLRRAALDRLSSASDGYTVDEVIFAGGCGLWFGAAWNNAQEETVKTFERLLALLQDDGLGGERSSGYGQFVYERREPVSLPDPASGKVGLLLSRYHPRAEELPGGGRGEPRLGAAEHAALNGPGTAYRLVAVGGWISSPDHPGLLRKRVHLVVEGSLVRLPGGVGGDLADVTPRVSAPACACELPAVAGGAADEQPASPVTAELMDQDDPPVLPDPPDLPEPPDLLDPPDLPDSPDLPEPQAPHRVYRYGLALSTAWPLNGEAHRA